MSNLVSVRECTLADAFALAVIGSATFVETFAGVIPGDALLAHCAKHHVASVYSVLLEQPKTRAWLAEATFGNAPVGYALVTTPDFPADLIRPDDLELRRIYLFSRFHGGGTGQRLVDSAIAEARRQRAKRLLLGVHPGNHRALGFYRKNGFVQVGTRNFHVGTSTFHDPVFALAL